MRYTGLSVLLLLALVFDAVEAKPRPLRPPVVRPEPVEIHRQWERDLPKSFEELVTEVQNEATLQLRREILSDIPAVVDTIQRLQNEPSSSTAEPRQPANLPRYSTREELKKCIRVRACLCVVAELKWDECEVGYEDKGFVITDIGGKTTPQEIARWLQSSELRALQAQFVREVAHTRYLDAAFQNVVPNYNVQPTASSLERKPTNFNSSAVFYVLVFILVAVVMFRRQPAKDSNGADPCVDASRYQPVPTPVSTGEFNVAWHPEYGYQVRSTAPTAYSIDEY